ncbi:TIGR03088 family PEP-CTERM/XrtA system glycosyltransferase [Thiohalophilus sp.]|uniref:TIGR03088 family PEP-CTERM/XrtA system glycosyltransferase n=1 Tax=Thiohalophilus sp. TaxID=3028392 RepID=UPI002ACDF957|nr:TIGR03088 family PEP-CTERM/XrtA system glycosyltransferase [Thiohalophilus sp.]MDZ7803467.1 TIGR03088 family PEP-CTERM/XrtA system glycosyltransferase [Thiohalophilus sp.]
MNKRVTTGEPPLVAHIIHRLDVGGMENGLVNLINHMPVDRYRHAIICMTDYTEFSQRIQRADVSLHSLHKHEGKDFGVHTRLYRLLRQLQPDIVHTRNLATLETQVTAWLARVSARVHGEHGWNVGDLDGSNRKNRRLRRLVRPLVDQYIALSQQQLQYLHDAVGVDGARLNHICNGVDVARFSPATTDNRASLPADFAATDSMVIGSVMRMQSVKAPGDLVQAFIQLRERLPAEQFSRLRLVMVGDGPLRDDLLKELTAAGLDSQSWLPGGRDDVPQLLRAMDLFVLPSLAEGICNTILEAMATGLPVIATRVGGNPDLIQPGKNGVLVPAGQPDSLADTLVAYLTDDARRDKEGQQARAMAEEQFSLAAMVDSYMAVYDKVLVSK